VKFLEKVTNVFAYIAGFCLAFMAIATTLNIFLRLLGKSFLVWMKLMNI